MIRTMRNWSRSARDLCDDVYNRFPTVVEAAVILAGMAVLHQFWPAR